MRAKVGSWGKVLLGVFATSCAFTSAANASTIQVTTTSDDPVSSGCSLRDAISSANTDTAAGNCAAGSGTDTVVVPAGTYRLTDTGAGYLNINRPATISGAGPAQTIIDGNNTNRVFNLAANASGSTIEGVTITHGHAPDGSPNGGTATSSDPATPAVGADGISGGSGGGVFTAARLTTLSDCVIRSNRAGDGGAGENAQGSSGASGPTGADGVGAHGGIGGNGGNGGGVYAHSATLTITDCQITDNSAGDGGTGGAANGGNGGDSSSGFGGNGGSAFAGNGGAGGSGGGIYIDHNFGGSGSLTISASVIDHNAAGGGGASNAANAGSGGDAGHGDVNENGGNAGGAGSGVGGSLAGGAGGSGGGVFTSVPATLVDSDISGDTAGSGHAGALARGSRGGTAVGGGFGGLSFAFAGAGGAGGAGGGIFSSAALTLARIGLTGDHAGAGGAGGAGVPGTGGTGGVNVNTTLTAGGAGGAGGSGGGLGTSGSAARSLSDVTVDSNGAGAGADGGSVSAGGANSGGGAGGAAGAGGGIDNEGGAITVSRSTVSANRLGDNGHGGSAQAPGADGAPGLDGGIDGGNGSSASGTIFTANDRPQCAGTVGDGGHDIVNRAADGCPGTVADPRLGSLADNGGLSPTRAIPASSPAINAYACTGLDQRGATRPAGAGCDIGAYEFAPPLASGEAVQRGDTQVVVHATITPNVSAAVSFAYGRTTGYGSSSPTQTITGSGPQTVSATITGLSRNTTYHFRVHATNRDGTITGSDVTFTTLGNPPAGGNPTALKLTKLSVKPATFAAAKPHAKRHHAPLGTTIRYTLSAKATVTLSFQRRSVGKRSHGRCVASRRTPSRASRCFRYAGGVGFTHTSNRGTTTLPFSGLIRKHALSPGTYRLTMTAKAGREHSHVATVTLTVAAS